MKKRATLGELLVFDEVIFDFTTQSLKVKILDCKCNRQIIDFHYLADSQNLPNKFGGYIIQKCHLINYSADKHYFSAAGLPASKTTKELATPLSRTSKLRAVGIFPPK